MGRYGSKKGPLPNANRKNVPEVRTSVSRAYILYMVLLLSEEKRRRCERIQTGVLTPGTGTSTKRKPQRGDRTSNCFVNSILKTLSPRRGFFCCRATTGGSSLRSGAGGVHPVCVLSSLRDFGQAPLNCLSSGKPNNRRISRGALDFPRTAIISTCTYLTTPQRGEQEGAFAEYQKTDYTNPTD